MRNTAGAGAGTRVWDETFHPEQIYTEQFFKQKLDYMHDDPVRAGSVDDPCDWRHSSARFYYRELPSAVPITPILW